MADELEIERVGGFAGFGLPGSHVKSRGRIALSALSSGDRATVEEWFTGGASSEASKPDAFRYRITRRSANGDETVELPEDRVPAAIRDRVKDELV